MATATATYGTENIERLVMAAARCEEAAMCLAASGDGGQGACSELAVAIGDPLHGWDESFAGVALKFDEGDVSDYERGVDLACQALGEGSPRALEVRRDCYVEMLATVFGLPEAKVRMDVERVRDSYATVELIDGSWL